MLFSRPSLECLWTLFSRFVKTEGFRIPSHSAFLDIWISGSFGPLAASSNYQGPASYSHEPLFVISLEARSTRLLSNAGWSRGNVRASVCFPCFGSRLRREFHSNVQLFPINEMDIRAVESPLTAATSHPT